MAAKKSGGFGETVRTVVVAVLIALVIRSVAFEPFNIPSGSMIPSLLIGDYLFVSKYAYGYSRYSFPFGLPLVPGPSRVLFSQPERGDVVVFKLPRDNKTDYIKRIVGLPGDTIEVKDGHLYISDQPVPRTRIKDYDYDGAGRRTEVPQYREKIGPHTFNVIEIYGDQGPLDNAGPFKVPPGHYFAMGDNRDNSTDSRAMAAVGLIPEENLVGRAEVIFFSTNGRAKIWEIWKWPEAIRWDRLFTTVD